jgi:hypothetical protein
MLNTHPSKRTTKFYNMHAPYKESKINNANNIRQMEFTVNTLRMCTLIYRMNVPKYIMQIYTVVSRNYSEILRVNSTEFAGQQSSIKNSKRIPWPESASELYRPSNRRLSAKLVLTFADRGVSYSQRGGSLRPESPFSRPEPLLFLPSSSSIVLTRPSGPRSSFTTSLKIW